MRLNLLSKIKIALLAIILGCLSPVANAQAQGQSAYPAPTNDYLNDYAGVMTPGDAEAIRTLFADLEKKTGIEAVVVTINSIGDYQTGDATIEAFATKLFNTWGIGHKKENNGVLILVAVKDRKARIELGKGYGRKYDSAMKQIIDNKMIPYFKTNDYSRGIYEGARAIPEAVTQEVSWFSYYKWHLLIGILILACIAAGISCMRSGKKGWGWAFFIAAGALLLFLIKMIFSSKSSSGFGGGSSFGGGASGSW